MRLMNIVTGAKVTADFEQPKAPSMDEPVLMIDEETGRIPCSKQGAEKFKFIQGAEEEKKKAIELGYHFAP